MKRVIMSFADSVSYKPEHPERTAKRGFGDFDVVFQEWPNRASMARSIRMQERGAGNSKNWKAIQTLMDGEGY